MNSEQPEPRRETKRKRGGQKGNQNARTHGFYSAGLSPAEISEFWDIITREGLAPEIALIRVKLRSSLENGTANRRVLEDASKLLAKWYSANLSLNKTELSSLKETILETLESCQPDFSETT